MKTLGRTDLPAEQQDALRSAIRWEWFTIGYTVVTIVLIAFVVSGARGGRRDGLEGPGRRDRGRPHVAGRGSARMSPHRPAVVSR